MQNAILSRANASQAALGASLLGLTAIAHAALPEAVGTTVTAISGDASAIFALVFPVVGTVLGLTIVIKLFKRFSNKV